MNTELFYGNLYDLINKTPLTFDCGRLCGAACCSTELPGMYLFPGEEALFSGRPGFAVSDAEMPGYERIRLLSCAGTCERDFRPLSCRIFPLAPKVSGDAVHARLDPRGRSICPLCGQPKASLSPGFIRAVEAAFAELLREPETASFLRALSGAVDEYGRPLL